MPQFGKGLKGQAKVKDDPLQMEQEMLRQQELRRKQEVLLRARLEELMDEEATMSKTSARNIQCRWMEWLRSQKHKELTAEIEIIRHTFDKTLDRKNAVIQMLSQDLEEAEEQYRLALRTHLSNVDALLDLQNRRMADLDVEFETDLLQLKRDFELERTEIQRKHELEKADLKLILQNMMTEAEQEDRKLQEETSESHDTSIEKMDEEKKQMQAELTKTNQQLRDQINEKYDEFVTNAQVQMKEYMELTKTDEDTANSIAAQMRKIQKLQESIGNWKASLGNNVRECEERNNAMRVEKETTAKHFKDLKIKMQRWRKLQEKRLATLVSQARKTKDLLQEKSDKAEQILRLAELCRALETERERILQFQSEATCDEVEQDVRKRIEKQMEKEKKESDAAAAAEGTVSMHELFSANETSVQDGDPPEGSEWTLLEKFWTKFNKSLLDTAAIDQEKYHLQHENAKLRALLKQYLDGISVNHDVMSQRNNLLHTAKVRNTIQGEQSRQVSIPVVEGNKVVCEVGKQRAF